MTDGPPPRKLTPREAEVLQLYALGHSYNEIAAKLGIGKRTVQFHLESARDKHGVSKSRLVALRAIQNGEIFNDGKV